MYILSSIRCGFSLKYPYYLKKTIFLLLISSNYVCYCFHFFFFFFQYNFFDQFVKRDLQFSRANRFRYFSIRLYTFYKLVKAYYVSFGV